MVQDYTTITIIRDCDFDGTRKSELQTLAHEFLHEQARESYCRQASYTVGLRGSVYSCDRNGFLTCNTAMDGTIQKRFPKSLQESLLYHSHHPWFHDWRDIRVKGVRTTVCQESTTAHIWQTPCIRLWGIAANAPEASQTINVGTPTITHSEWPSWIFRNKQPGTIYGEVKRQSVPTGNDRSLVKVNESLTHIQDDSVAHCAFFMDDWIIQYGIPMHVLSKKRTQVVSKFFETLCTFLRTKHLTTMAYQSQVNGKVEQFNTMIIVGIRQYAAENRLDCHNYVQRLTYSYNLQIHFFTKLTTLSQVLERHSLGMTTFDALTVLKTDIKAIIYPHAQQARLLQNTAIIRQYAEKRMKMRNVIWKAAMKTRFAMHQAVLRQKVRANWSSTNDNLCCRATGD